MIWASFEIHLCYSTYKFIRPKFKQIRTNRLNLNVINRLNEIGQFAIVRKLYGYKQTHTRTQLTPKHGHCAQCQS